MRIPEPGVVARGLRLAHHDRPEERMFRALDFEVRPGTVVALVGPNGVGKTTVMRAVLGMVSVRSGRVTVGGIPAGRYRRRFGVGHLPDHPVPPSGWTVGAWIATASQLRGSTRRRARGETEAILASLGLEGRGDERVDRLSWGTTRKVALAFALVGGPSLIGLDEPMAGLDAGARLRVRTIVRELPMGDATVLVSTHDLASARGLAARAIVLSGDGGATCLDIGAREDGNLPERA